MTVLQKKKVKVRRDALPIGVIDLGLEPAVWSSIMRMPNWKDWVGDIAGKAEGSAARHIRERVIAELQERIDVLEDKVGSVEPDVTIG